MITDDRQLLDALCVGLLCVLLAWLIIGITRYSTARRPGLGLAWPLAAAAAARLAVAASFSAVPSLEGLRGGDEQLFLEQARLLADDGSALGSFPASLVGDLHVWLIALQVRALDAPGDLYLRVGQVALVVGGIALLASAVYDLAGARAGTLVAWILAFEPSNVFFSGLLHKEAAALLGEGLVFLGCVRMYKRRDLQAVAIMISGLAVAGLTRPYIGAALAVGCILSSLHASLRKPDGKHRRAPVLALAVLVSSAVAIVAAPAPSSVLDKLQTAQNANVSDASNLKLEPVDFSSPQSVVQDGPKRVFDVLFRPFPWQVANTSQRLGVLGTGVAWIMLTAMIVLAASRPRLALSRLPPIMYALVFVTLAYALATGNAGTGFRYRTHILFGLAAVTAILVVPRNAVRPVPRDQSR